jgi:cytoskeleton protein RodZ
VKERSTNNDGDMFPGARLAACRRKLGITIDKAAKDTRITAARLRQIEADDFSGFSYPTYARLFLKDYATYLGVPVEEVRDKIPGSEGFGGKDNHYVDALLEGGGFFKDEQFKSIRRLLFALGILVLVLLAAGLAFWGWRTWRNLERVNFSREIQTIPPEAASTPTAPPPSAASTPVASPTPSPTAPPRPAVSPTPAPTPFFLPPFEPSEPSTR